MGRLSIALFTILLLGTILLTGSLLASCRDEADPSDCPPIDPSPPGVETDRAADTLAIGSRRYLLECTLWRDFMPINPPGGRPLIAVIRLTEIDSLPIPEGMDADFLWVVHGGGTWGTRFDDEPRPPTPPHQFERVARCGPMWDPGSRVDVVVRVVDPAGGRRLIRARDQEIIRTD